MGKMDKAIEIKNLIKNCIWYVVYREKILDVRYETQYEIRMTSNEQRVYPRFAPPALYSP